MNSMSIGNHLNYVKWFTFKKHKYSFTTLKKNQIILEGCETCHVLTHNSLSSLPQKHRINEETALALEVCVFEFQKEHTHPRLY